MEGGRHLRVTDTDTDFNVYGMKLQPRGADGDIDTFGFCRNEGIVGVGWGGIADRTYETADEVRDAHLEKQARRSEQGKETGEVLSDGRLNAPLRYILREMGTGDFVWVNEGNKFALCRVTADWNVAYNLSDEAFERYESHDIIHFRPVDWVSVPYELVPGYVRRRFSGRFGTMQQMQTGVNEDSKAVLQALHSQADLDTDRSLDRARIADKIVAAETDRLFDILSSEETEDIVISYLQSEGWRIIKSSTSNSQATIECEMRTETGDESIAGYLQVKTGSAGLNPDTYEEYADTGQMFFFVQSGVSVEGRDGMVAIEPATIHEYMATDYNYLPNETLLKLDFAL